MSSDDTVRPSSDTGWWLYEYQKTMTNVRGLISNGKSESAVAMIDALTERWRIGCHMEEE